MQSCLRSRHDAEGDQERHGLNTCLREVEFYLAYFFEEFILNAGSMTWSEPSACTGVLSCLGIMRKDKNDPNVRPQTLFFVIWEGASGRRQLGEGIWDETTEEASRRRHLGGDI